MLIIGIVAISLITVAYAAPAVGTSGVAAINATPSITGCQSGFYGGGTFPIAADNCSACAAGTYTAANNSVTTCTACEAGNYCPAPTPTTGTTTGAAKTTCPVGAYCTASVAAPTWCASGTFIAGTGNDAASDCQTFTGTAITGCKIYETNTGTITCNVAADGYFLGAAAPTATVTACLTNCGACTGATYALCTAAKPGFF